MFQPNEIIFVPESRCNLHCPSCYVSRDGAHYPLEYATAFLQDCTKHEILRVGFSGGEPFLRPEFLYEVCKTAIEQDLLFDRIMTNAVWWSSQQELENVLQTLFDHGFDGSFGISYDCWHGQEPAQVATFIKTATSIWKDHSMLQIIIVRQGNETKTVEMIEALSNELNAELILDSNGFPAKIRFNDSCENLVSYEGKNNDEILIGAIDFVPYNHENPKYWNATEWFTDDYCEGPGNVLYVHGDGTIAACCGYANELEELIIGNIRHDSFEQLISNAKNREMVHIAYVKGLSSELKRLQEENHSFPGKTDNICLFCRYLINHKRKENQK